MREKKTGLVLEGGGMRGIYTAGVLDVFMENGITFDGVIGVSAGAIHGCSFVSGQKGRSIRYYMKYCRNWQFMSFRSLLLTGNIAGEKFCYHTLPEKLDPYDYEAFKKSPTKFYVGCSNVETGKAEYLPITDMKEQIDRMRASASLPLVSRKYPEFVKAVYRRPSVYNHTLDEIEKWEEEGKIFVIRPSVPLTIGRMEADPKKIKEVYELGRDDARRQIEDMKVFLGIE